MNKIIARLLVCFFITSSAFLASAQDAVVILSVGGQPALKLQAPAGAKVISSNGYVNIKTTNMSLYVWAVTDARTIREAAPRVPELIKSEFLKFKTTASVDLTIADAPAQHISGSGNEADDGDPGNAQVVLFVVGGHVFAACVHGEFDDSTRALPHMMAVLKTVRAAR